MKHWIDQIKDRSDAETAKLIIQVFSGALLLTAIIAGNWNLIA